VYPPRGLTVTQGSFVSATSTVNVTIINIIPCKKNVFLCSKTCICVGDLCYSPVASAIVVLAEESIDPESITITRLQKQQFTWDLHKQVKSLLDSTRMKIFFKYTVESSCSALISIRLWLFSIHLYSKLIYVIP